MQRIIRRSFSACFNSRSREGSDRKTVDYFPHFCSFNSRSREGSDV